MKSKRLLRILVITLLGATTLSTISPKVANAAWIQNNTGWWYTEGSSWSVGWRQIDGVWYYFDANGYMKTGWVQDNGVWYYMDNSGAMKTGWIIDNGVWYYLEGSGAMRTGWLGNREELYYLHDSGAMAQGWQTIEGEKYYFKDSGEAVFGKTGIGDDLYYFNVEKGIIVKNLDTKFVTTDSNGKITKFDAEGAKQYILANDFDYINKCKKSSDIYFMEPDLDLIVNNFCNNTVNAYYEMEDENCLAFYCMSNTNNYETLKCIYLLGLESGKIYCMDNTGHKEIYEIKDNKKVATYADIHSNEISNWR